MFKKLNEKNKHTLISVIISALCTVTLMMGLTSMSVFLSEMAAEPTSAKPWIFEGFAFLSIAIYNVLLFARYKSKWLRVAYVSQTALCLVSSVLLFVLRKNITIYAVTSVLYLIGLVIYIAMNLRERHKIRQIARAVICFALLSFAILMVIVGGMDIAAIMINVMMAAVSLASIIYEAFSKIKFATIGNIIRRTYTLEILLGLVSLIIAFSYVFHIEENISYGDALWYCFAIVTTIGFGDVTVASNVSRVLSVILGIYGIIVVALITSIIVNFYNETKFVGKKEDAPEPEDKKEE